MKASLAQTFLHSIMSSWKNRDKLNQQQWPQRAGKGGGLTILQTALKVFELKA